MTLLALCLLTPALGAMPAQASEAPTTSTTTRTTTVTDTTPTATDVARALDKAGDKVAETAAPSQGLIRAPRDPERGITLGAEGLTIGIPGADSAANGVVVDGVTVYRDSERQSAVAVNPTVDGGQLLVTVGASDSPTSYRFPLDVPSGAKVRLTEDGGAEVALRDGRLVTSIPAPWAEDAAGKEVATRFRIKGNTLIQDIDHTVRGTAYPVVADPRFFRCDWYTHTCVKFTKRETQRIDRRSGLLGGTISALAGAACALIGGGWQGAALCTLTVAAAGGDLADKFAYAADHGKCVELHFLGAFGALTRWKVEGC